MTTGVLAAASGPLATPSLACAACFGQSDSAQAQGLNAGIFALLGFVALFWMAMGSFFLSLSLDAIDPSGMPCRGTRMIPSTTEL